MLSIRLTRRGKKNQPFFRMVVAERSRPIKGRFIEVLGHYNPRTKELILKEERIKHWLKQGAKASPTVHNLLVDKKIIEGVKRKATTTKAKAKLEGKETAGTVDKPI